MFHYPDTLRMFSVGACCTTSQSMPVSNIVPEGLCIMLLGIRTSKLIDYLILFLSKGKDNIKGPRIT